MNDVIAPKRSSLRPKLVEATMFLKLSMSLIPINLVDVVESLIWNTLIPFSLELVDDIDDPNDKRRHNALYCITGHRDQYRANGLAFMPVFNTGVIFSFFFFFSFPNDNENEQDDDEEQDHDDNDDDDDLLPMPVEIEEVD
jgi:hypothetical protein